MESAKAPLGRYYEIKVEGYLDEARLAGFTDLQVRLLPEGSTLIFGKIVDQSALFGILIRIRDLGIPLISVNSAKLVES